MKNSLLYISNFLEATGYSEAARNLCKSIFYQDFPTIANNIKLTHDIIEPDKVIKELLNRNSRYTKDKYGSPITPNISLIHSLPYFFQYDSYFKYNIGRFDWECDNFISSSWPKYCNLMDRLWVASSFQKTIMKQAAITTPIDIVPHPIDRNRFEYNDNRPGFVSHLKRDTGNYVFYTIGEFVSRKNYEGLLRAWHSHFSIYDKVELIIKTSKSGTVKAELDKILEGLNEHVKRSLKVNKRWVKDPIFVTERFEQEDLDKLHIESDCFVSATHGEGWLQPAQDAMCFGKPCILPKYSGYLDYADDTNSYLVNGFVTNCYGTADVGPDLYNGYQKWFEPDISHMGLLMKLIAKNKDLGVDKGKEGRKLLDKYDYSAIGRLAVSLLNKL